MILSPFLSLFLLTLSMSQRNHLILPSPQYDRNEDALKRMHSSVEYAFESYRKQLTRVMTQFDFISKSGMSIKLNEERLQIVYDQLRRSISQIPEKWEDNELLLRELTQSGNDMLQYMGQDRTVLKELSNSDLGESKFSKQPKTEASNLPPSSYDSCEQILFHLHRDWGSTSGSKLVRKNFYGAVLAAVNRFVLDNQGGSDAAILCPGSGLGRLAVEMAALGLTVEANECSNLMAAVFHGLLLRFSQASSASLPAQFYPFLAGPMMDEWRFDRRLDGSQLPGKDADGVLSYLQSVPQRDSPASLTLQLGSFVDVYSHPNYGAKFDAVTTCFFIDTSADLVQTVAVISHALREGGIWINLGPLHYHSNATRVPFSHDLLLRVVEQGGFTILSDDRVSSSYSGEEELSMKPEYYNVPLTVYRLSDASMRYSMSSADSHSPDDSPSHGIYPSPNFVLK